jgi:hypothetical protein
MTASRTDLMPSISLEQFNDLFHFYALRRIARASAFYNEPVDICLSVPQMGAGDDVLLFQNVHQICERRNYGSVPRAHRIETIRIEQVWIHKHRGCHPQLLSSI